MSTIFARLPKETLELGFFVEAIRSVEIAFRRFTNEDKGDLKRSEKEDLLAFMEDSAELGDFIRYHEASREEFSKAFLNKTIHDYEFENWRKSMRDAKALYNQINQYCQMLSDKLIVAEGEAYTDEELFKFGDEVFVKKIYSRKSFELFKGYGEKLEKEEETENE